MAAVRSAAPTLPGPRSAPNFTLRGPQKTREELIAELYDVATSPKALVAKKGIAVAIPAQLGAARLTRSRAPKDASHAEVAAFDFEGNRTVRIYEWSDAAEALQLATTDDRDRDLAVYNKAVRIGQYEGRAIDKLDIGPVDDPTLHDPAYGTKVVGTGVYTGAARVTWTVGDYMVEVADSDGGVDQLLADVQAAWGAK